MVEGAKAKVKPIVKVDVHAPIFYFPKFLFMFGIAIFIIKNWSTNEK